MITSLRFYRDSITYLVPQSVSLTKSPWSCVAREYFLETSLLFLRIDTDWQDVRKKTLLSFRGMVSIVLLESETSLPSLSLDNGR